MNFVYFLFPRSSKQDFFEVHGKIRRGDIIGIKGSPGRVVSPK